MAEENLDDVRRRIREIDGQILGLAAERQRLAREVGEIKRRVGIATVDYAQERAVLERARATAQERGLDPSIAEDLLARLMSWSPELPEALVTPSAWPGLAMPLA